MKAIFVSIYFVFLLNFTQASGLESLRHFFYKTISSSAIYDITNADKSFSKRSISPKPPYCDENKLMLSLADSEIISPERIILLLTRYDSSIQVCSEVSTTIRGIENDLKDCRPLDDDNLYMMLFNGLKMFELVFCKDEKYQKQFDGNAQCIRELREEYIDCEGPGDWFEFPNKTIGCGIFTDITACDYIKTAELCGVEVGTFFYCIITKVIVASLKYPCDVPRKLPKIKAFAAELTGLSGRLYPWNFLIILVVLGTL